MRATAFARIIALSPGALQRSAKFTPPEARRQVANTIVANRRVEGEQITSLPHDLSAYLVDSENAIDVEGDVVAIGDLDKAFDLPTVRTGLADPTKENKGLISRAVADPFDNPLNRPLSNASSLETSFKTKNGI